MQIVGCRREVGSHGPVAAMRMMVSAADVDQRGRVFCRGCYVLDCSAVGGRSVQQSSSINSTPAGRCLPT